MQGKYFVLTADIGDSENGFTKSIGDEDHPFKGHFDGLGHTVTLNINNTQTKYVGLFGHIESSAVICNVNTAGRVEGHTPAGICALADYGTIFNCSNSATIIGSGAFGAGGICAFGCPTIINCYNSGEVSGAGMSVGGIYGLGDGKTTNSYYDNAKATGGAGGTGLSTYLMQLNPADTLTGLLNSYIANNPDTTAGACKWEATKDGYPRLVPATAKEDENGLNTGSALSEGNMTIIIAIAAAVLFGLGGFFVGNAFSKKKKLAPVAATSSEDDE